MSRDVYVATVTEELKRLLVESEGNVEKLREFQREARRNDPRGYDWRRPIRKTQSEPCIARPPRTEPDTATSASTPASQTEVYTPGFFGYILNTMWRTPEEKK